MTLPGLRRMTSATTEIRALRDEIAALRAEVSELRERVEPRPAVRRLPGVDRVCEWGPATYSGARRR
jgi:hypothetical protein